MKMKLLITLFIVGIAALLIVPNIDLQSNKKGVYQPSELAMVELPQIKKVYSKKNRITLPKIKCYSTLGKGYGTCESKKIKDFYASRVDARAERGSTGVSDDRKMMTYEMAVKTCKEREMRVPEILELHSMYHAAKAKEIKSFVEYEYWARNDKCSKDDEFNCHNCNMSPWRGDCGRAHYQTLNYVRCVK